MDMNSLKYKLAEVIAAGAMKEIGSANELYIEIDGSKLRETCLHLGKDLGFRLVSMFANDERQIHGSFRLYHVFADPESGAFAILITAADSNLSYQSIADEIHTAASYEREIHDLFGLEAVGHPDLKRLVFHGNWPEGVYPLRKDFDRHSKPSFASLSTSFFKVEGAGIYEIPVGPVHAGIIEPGHFRFSVAGEPIINLEAQLFFVHKGIEKLCEGMSFEKCFYVAERISGDETFANSLAYCQAVEKLAEVEIPVRAEYTRVVFAELERLTAHLGDLAGICVDVAYGFAAFQFRMMRGWAYQIADELCGMRFLRSVNIPGGVRKDFVAGKEKKIAEMIDRIRTELTDTINIIKSNNLFIDRVENTGVLKNNIAVDLNAVGPAGRASGVNCDVRKCFPYAVYDRLEFKVPEHNNGDVNCRMNVKLEECFESMKLILSAVESMPEGTIKVEIGTVKPYRAALGYTESPRGENIHWIMSGENNTIFRYKVRTPSFCNWPALCHAVKGNIVPDFPLINKSFNLSYAGNDL
jgi:Ni,Fe-hydrogenase III large subunit/Ni,Fe-hydrogenase III component G